MSFVLLLLLFIVIMIIIIAWIAIKNMTITFNSRDL